MMSSVENFLNRSYPRFASTTTTTTANVLYSQSVDHLHALVQHQVLLSYEY